MYKDSPSGVFTSLYCKKSSEGLVVGNIDNYTQNFTPNTGKYQFGILRFQDFKTGESNRGLTPDRITYASRKAMLGILNKEHEAGRLDVIWCNKKELHTSNEYQINGVDCGFEDIVNYFNDPYAELKKTPQQLCRTLPELFWK